MIRLTFTEPIDESEWEGWKKQARESIEKMLKDSLGQHTIDDKLYKKP